MKGWLGSHPVASVLLGWGNRKQDYQLKVGKEKVALEFYEENWGSDLRKWDSELGREIHLWSSLLSNKQDWREAKERIQTRVRQVRVEGVGTIEVAEWGGLDGQNAGD